MEFAWSALVLKDHSALQPLPSKAARTVRQPADPAEVEDLRPKSDNELAIVSLKRCAELLCVLSKEALRLGYADLAIHASDAARSVIASDIAALQHPVDMEIGIHIAGADYVKAESLAQKIEAEYTDAEVVLGVKEEDLEKQKAEKEEYDVDVDARLLTADERTSVLNMKEAVLSSLLLGMAMAYKFQQPWLLHNGIAWFWNLHRELTENERYADALDAYHDALEQIFDYLFTLPPSDFDHDLAKDLTLAMMKSLVSRGSSDAIPDYCCKPRNGGTHAMIAMLGRLQSKEVAAELTRILRGEGKAVPAFPLPKEIEDLQAKAPPAAKGDKD